MLFLSLVSPADGRTERSHVIRIMHEILHHDAHELVRFLPREQRNEYTINRSGVLESNL
jgi:hypothetical protein